MNEFKNASRTALGTAYARAAHQVLDASPHILEDPVAVPIFGPGGFDRFHAHVEKVGLPEPEGLRAHVVLRARFTEDRLAEAVGRGVTQYVILGAGLDTFALRQPSWAESMRIIEVDQPDTQGLKRSMIEKAGFAVPANVCFASVDFQKESLRDALDRNGVAITEPTLFSWLGVTMYLPEPAIDEVLTLIATFPPGSEVVLTFAPPRGESVSPFEERAVALGEPWLSYFSEQDLEAKLRAIGFTTVGFLTPEMAEERYFRQRPRDLPVPKPTKIAYAVR